MKYLAITWVVFCIGFIAYKVYGNEIELAPHYAIGVDSGWHYAETIARAPYIIRAENQEVICYIMVDRGGLSCKWKEETDGNIQK